MKREVDLEMISSLPRAVIPPWPPEGFAEHPNAKKERENIDMSIKDEFKKKGVEGPPLLHGTDLPKNVNSVVIVVKELRTAPDNFGSIAILDLARPVYDCEAWAVNKTNLRALLEKFGVNEDAEIEELSAKMEGKKLTLNKVMVNNPQTKKMGPSLFVA